MMHFSTLRALIGLHGVPGCSYRQSRPTLWIVSGVARPGPNRACALPSTLQALPSAISFESRDSTMDQTKINCSANNHKSVTNINATA